ncbi:helix-turn-helix domain-containing protein [Viscerimonas tarda]
MNNKLNSGLVAEILSKIPPDIKPIDYLMDILDLSKESAYRRMRSEIPFTFGEIANLAQRLNFSVDEIIGKEKNNRVFLDLHTDSFSKPEETFLAMLKEYSKHIEAVSKSKNMEIKVSINRISLMMLIKSDILFKFFYYKWMHQIHSTSFGSHFSEIVIPAELISIQQAIKENVSNLRNFISILDRDIFLSIVREIQYYYNRGLISEKDVLELKANLLELLDHMGITMQRGYNESGARQIYFLSLLGIDSNSGYASYDENEYSLYWIYSVNFVTITNHDICVLHKDWFESLRKTSVLITQSNEILQAEFFEKQRRYIEHITNAFFYYG